MGVTLPDWGAAIGTQVNAFLGWSAITGPMQFMLAMAVGAVGVSLVLAVFMRGR